MKKALKILIPLVLVLGLLAGACWYFLFYDRELTTDLLVDAAEDMYSSGRYSRAITYYGWAKTLAPRDTNIPLALADTYVADGNYTKAEFTLVNAISANPDCFDLYAALCRTYVAQDKLLDAVQMLDRITDDTVLTRLETLRPAAPVVLPESGYYTEYIELTVDSPEQRVYVTTDGEYPSDDGDFYTEAVTLPSGESTVIALAVSDEGLVSPVTMCGYTIGGVVEEVTLTDPAVDHAVRALLNMAASDTIMSDDLWSIGALELPETVADLSDLVHFTGLKSLSIHNVSGLDLTVLRQLTGLNELDLSGCTISSNAMEAIGSLTELRKLVLDGCALMDLTAFSQLTKLTELHLSNNTISDIGVLSLMLELETVTLANNPITSIAGLSTCANLKYVDVTGCGIASIGSLSEKTALETVLASGNEIVDLSPLSGCKRLATLMVSDNMITDISVLAELPALLAFEGDNNLIKEIPDFKEDQCKLVRFSANYNEIEDLSGLADIDTLNYVNLDYNKVKDIAPLVNNINLIQVDVWDNPIAEVEEAVKPFEESSIIVNFNPNYEVPEEEEKEE